MLESKTFSTSYKLPAHSSSTPQANLYTRQQLSLRDQQIDYQVKYSKLAKQIAECEINSRKYESQLKYYQQQLQTYQQNQQLIFNLLRVNDIHEAITQIQGLINQNHTDKNHHQYTNYQKIEEWEGIIKQYKRIINAQQYKLIKLQQQFKITQVKLKKQQQEKEEYLKEKKQLIKEKEQFIKEKEIILNEQRIVKTLENKEEQWQRQINKVKASVQEKQNESNELKQEVRILKSEYKQSILEKEQIQETLQELQEKYNVEIQHFSDMQKHVEERLIEVEKEMTYYRQEREEHIEKIELMKKQLEFRQNSHYFSFGGVQHQETQTDFFEEDISTFNNQCLEISIRTLLEENQRLKNTLMLLYNRQPEEALSKEVELELKILLNTRGNLLKLQPEKYETKDKEHVDGEKKQEMASPAIEQQKSDEIETNAADCPPSEEPVSGDEI